MTSEPAGDPRRAAIEAARARRIVGRATVRQLASYAAIAVVALVGPGLIAISQRPDNAAEGVVAVAAGVAVLAWLARRAVTTGSPSTPTACTCPARATGGTSPAPPSRDSSSPPGPSEVA